MITLLHLTLNSSPIQQIRKTPHKPLKLDPLPDLEHHVVEIVLKGLAVLGLLGLLLELGLGLGAGTAAARLAVLLRLVPLLLLLAVHLCRGAGWQLHA